MDKQFGEEVLKRWKTALKEMVQSKAIEFPKTTTEEGADLVEMIGYWDGSKLAYAAVVYLRCRYRLTDENYKWNVNILAVKARVTPANGLTTPRAELNGLLILTRLLSAYLDSLARLPSRVPLI